MLSGIVTLTEDPLDVKSSKFGLGRGFRVHQIPNRCIEDYHGWELRSQSLHPTMETNYTNTLTHTTMGGSLSTNSDGGANTNKSRVVQPTQELRGDKVHHTTITAPDCVNINNKGNETRNHMDTQVDKKPE